jgi:alkyl hydroperoxide reductase subunit D
MSALTDLGARLPDHVRDLRLNLAVIGGAGELSPRHAWGTALTAALAARNPEVIAAIASEAAPHLDDAASRAARTAASLMAMNNVYYRFTHAVGGDYEKLPARLRMQAIGNPGVDKLDFELWCLAASAINGCQACMHAHERAVRDRGATAGMVQDAIRIAAVVNALAVTVEGEAAFR